MLSWKVRNIGVFQKNLKNMKNFSKKTLAIKKCLSYIIRVVSGPRRETAKAVSDKGKTKKPEVDSEAPKTHPIN